MDPFLYLHSLEGDGDAVLGDGPDLAQGVRRRPDGDLTNLETRIEFE